MAFLGDLITTRSRLQVDTIIKAKANELRRRMGLTVTEESEIATAMFVAVMQAQVVRSMPVPEEYAERIGDALGTCDEIIRDAIQRRKEPFPSRPYHEERAYQQGRKDAARTIAISFEPHHKTPVSEDE